MPTPRQFSQKSTTTNMLNLKHPEAPASPAYRVGFLLLENFSMASFTVAMDVLVTANLLQNNLFTITPLSLGSERVMSDLGLEIYATGFQRAQLDALDMLVVCGGLRTPLKYPQLDRLLTDAASQGLALGGLWNGAYFLGRAGVLVDYSCT
ncbi:MAG: GlxA family transcriptional regulator, partial [Pseudomonas sp.]